MHIDCDGNGALCEGEGVHLVGDLHLCNYCRRLLALEMMEESKAPYMSTYQHYIHNPATCPLDRI